MSGTHGDLFREIGAIVVAAHEGEPIELDVKAEDLAQRYAHLRVSREMVARAIARSAGAVGVSFALVQLSKDNAIAGGDTMPDEELSQPEDAAAGGNGKSMLFPSGVRLAVLS